MDLYLNILYIPYYLIAWLFIPVKKKEKSIINLNVEYRDVGKDYESVLFEMKRIDLAIDVADNPSLQHKAHQEIFTSGQVDDFQFIDSKYGYSVSFGNKDNLQLNIYDKKSEVFFKSGGSDILPFILNVNVLSHNIKDE